jgi:tetratricopeptide (TPR) repeat protein
VIHQDFRHPHTYWLPLVFDSDASIWREVEAVREGGTVTFQPLALVGGPAQADYSDATFTSEQAEAVFRRRIRGSAKRHAQPYRLALLRRKTIERDGAGVARLATEILAAARPTDPIVEQLAQIRRTYADEALAAAMAALGRGAPADVAACAEWLGSEPEAALLRGLLHEHRGETAQAAACYASAGDAVETVRARCLRAQVLLLAGRPQAACEHLERALLLRGGEGPVQRAFQLLQTALERRGDAAAAVDVLDRLAPVWLGDARYEILRATALCHAGRREEGRERLLGVLRRDPQAARAKQLLEEWFP